MQHVVPKLITLTHLVRFEPPTLVAHVPCDEPARHCCARPYGGHGRAMKLPVQASVQLHPRFRLACPKVELSRSSVQWHTCLHERQHEGISDPRHEEVHVIRGMSVGGALMLVGVTISLDSEWRGCDESLYCDERLLALPTSNLNTYYTYTYVH